MSKLLFGPFMEGGSSGSTHARLLSLARRVSAEYAANPKVAAILIAGSVSRGVVDAVSDIDSSVYLHQPFTEEEFEAEKNRAIASGGGLYSGNAEQGFALWHCVDGVKYDIGFTTVAEMDELFAEVLEKHSMENDLHLISDGVYKSLPLYGEEIIRGWQEQLGNFPEELAKKMVEQHLRVSPLWVARDMCAGRDEQVWFPEMALEYVRRMLWVLCGLNRRYYPGKLKGFAYVVNDLRIVPENFLYRVENLFQLEPTDAIPVLKKLVEDVYDLVTATMPDVDVAPAWKWFTTKVACRQGEG